MKYIIALLFLLMAPQAHGIDLLRPTRVDIAYEVLRGDGNRNALLQQVKLMPTARLALSFDVSILKYGYMANEIESYLDSAQFRTVGWEYELGIKPCSVIDIYMHHHSEHLLDIKSNTRFPVMDTFGIRIHLIRGKK